MSLWITFSNGDKACYCPEYGNKFEELGKTIPRKENGEPNYQLFHEGDWIEVEKIRVEERGNWLAEFCQNKWPGKGVSVTNCQALPYDASPVIGPGAKNAYTLCYSPNECAGHGSCPKRRACSE